ncbi:MAG: hypothetical protein V2J25_04100 [Desulfatiglans sp.]|nr:hypothetical protein [Desulfatiglans sp.]
MFIIERARIRIEHWMTHNDHHKEEYEIFADQLEEAGRKESADHIRDMIELTAGSSECLRRALKALE